MAKEKNKIGFFKSLKKELENVKWLSNKETIKYTIATLVFIVFFGGYFYLINFLFALLKEVFN